MRLPPVAVIAAPPRVPATATGWLPLASPASGRAAARSAARNRATGFSPFSWCRGWQSLARCASPSFDLSDTGRGGGDRDGATAPLVLLSGASSSSETGGAGLRDGDPGSAYPVLTRGRL